MRSAGLTRRVRKSGAAQGDGPGEGGRRFRVGRELAEPWTGAHDPHSIPLLPAELWGKPGQRAWQYAGAYDKRPCQVLGLDVDINVADVGCLANPPGGQQAHHGRAGKVRRRLAPGPPRLQRASVQQLTRRLSFVPSKRTGHPYLNGPRGSLGPEAEAALKAFQREHRLAADGVYGPDTQQALARAIQLERARRQGAQKRQLAERQPTKENGKPRKPAATLRGLIDEVRRLDAETDRAWRRLVAYGTTRRRLAGKAGAGRDPSMAEITAILRRMEQTLEALVPLEQRELALEHPATAEPTAATKEQSASAAYQPEPSATMTATLGGGDNGSRETSAAGATAAPALRLDQLTDEQLLERVDRFDRAISRSRMALMRRYVEAEKALGVRAPRREVRPGEPKLKEPLPTHTRPKHRGRRGRGEAARPGQARPSARGARQGAPERPQRLHREALENVAPLMVDGVQGPATEKRIAG